MADLVHQKERQDHQRMSGADVRNLLSRTQPVSTRGSNAVMKKLNWDTGQTRTPIGLELVFQRTTQAVDSPLAAKMSKLPPRVPWRIIQHWKCIFGKKMTSKNCQKR